jgi:integrase
LATQLSAPFQLVDWKNPDGKKKCCYPHMFRDTFAVELLLAGVPLDQVAILLGHKSIKTTEKTLVAFCKSASGATCSGCSEVLDHDEEEAEQQGQA